MSKKICTACGSSGPFYKDPTHKDGLQSRCSKCVSKYVERYRNNTNNKKKIADYRLWKKYGITRVQFNRLLRAQSAKCDICRVKLTGRRKAVTPHVDHCHKSGKVRGILCTRCNVLIGMALDNSRVMVRAAVYLKRFGL